MTRLDDLVPGPACRAHGRAARGRTQPARGASGSLVVAGVDEAGRGPLAGPVVAAAVILDPARPIANLRDSKQLTAHARTALSCAIRERALAWALGRADVTEIDALNVLQASMLAMRRAVLALDVAPAQVLVDGNRCPELPFATRSVVGGDRNVRAISAASILAKTARDAEMREIDRRYPQYGFARHMGYPTVEHVSRLRRFGVSPVHRLTFGPVKAMLDAMGAQVTPRLEAPARLA